MLVEIKSDEFQEFVTRAKSLDGWLHHYNFNDKLITGYFKYQGIHASKTIAAESDANFQEFRDVYSTIDHSQLRDCLLRAIATSEIQPSRSAALELGASSGAISLHLADAGFSRVAASEIRKTGCDQIELIKEHSTSPNYRRISVRHDERSIDHPDFPALFNGEKFDLIVCSRTLNHLAHPIQAIRNMGRLSKGHVFIYCQTMVNALPSRMWSVLLPSHKDLTSSIEDVSVTPHYWWIPENAERLGFSLCSIDQAAVFSKHMQWLYNAYGLKQRARLILERAMHIGTSIRIGHMKALDSELMISSGLSPRYFGYLLRHL